MKGSKRITMAAWSQQQVMVMAAFANTAMSERASTQWPSKTNKGKMGKAVV
jgi:hypothetical protein